MKTPPTLDISPLVDVTSTLIVVLMALGIAGEVASLPVDQELSDPVCGVPPPVIPLPPPLTLHIRADGVWIGRWVDRGAVLPRTDAGLDLQALRGHIATDRLTWPFQREVILVTDDGQRYGDLTAALDLTRRYGYDRPLLGGGPPLVEEPPY